VIGAAPLNCNYRIYGLNIQTSVPLSGVVCSPENSAPDLNVVFAKANEKEPLPESDWQPASVSESRRKQDIKILCTGAGAGGAIRFEYQTRFIGRVCSVINEDASSLWLQFEDNVSQQDKSSFFMGTVLGSILRRRGKLCLHASAFVINDKAALIIGRRGAGKSTTTAAMLRHAGARLITDDVSVVETINKQLHVLPGYAGLRLNPDTVEPILNQRHDSMPNVFELTDKRFVKLNSVTQFQAELISTPVPIGAMYILASAEGDETFIENLDRLSTLLTLVENTYCKYAVIDKQHIEKEFRGLSDLMDSVPIKRVRRHSGLDRLPELCRDIANDLGAA